MAKTLIVCSILQPELEKVMEELGLSNRLRYIDGALHVNLDKLKNALTEALDEVAANNEEPAIIVGTKCHPEMKRMAKDYNADIMCAVNCIDLLIGEEKMRELEEECNTFYITAGWLINWKDIFQVNQGWDSIDARIAFGRYERTLLLDTGLQPFTEEDMYAFFEYTEIPIETYPITLDYMKERILELVGF